MQQVCDLSAEGDHQSSKTCVAYHRALSCYLVFPERVQRFATGATIGGRDKRSSTLAPYRFVVVMFLECRAKCCSVMHLCKPLVLNGFHRAAYFPPVSLRGLIGHAARSGLTKGMAWRGRDEEEELRSRIVGPSFWQAPIRTPPVFAAAGTPHGKRTFQSGNHVAKMLTCPVTIVTHFPLTARPGSISTTTANCPNQSHGAVLLRTICR